MNLKSKILAAGLAAIIAGAGIFATNINTVQAQTDNGDANPAIAQMMQMIETLKQQIQQIIALIAQLKPQETCGNGKCRFGETAATCPADCATETCVKEGGIIDWRLPRTPECCTGLTKILDCSESNCSKSSNSVCTYCGNGICGAGENSYNCPADCNTTACTAEGRTKSMSMPDCCAGLKSILNQIPAGDGTCGGVPNDGSVICANCGNGICGAGENKCNCPADCGQITACAKEGVIVLPYQSCCAGLARIACSGNYCHDNGSGICAKCGNGICGLGEAAANCPADCFGAKTCYSEGEGETGEVGLTAGITIPCCSGLYPNGTQAVTGGFICRKLIADFNNTKPDTVVNCKKEGELFGYLEGECCDGLLKVYPDGAKTYSAGESQNFQVTCKKPASYITNAPDKCVAVNIKALANNKYVTAENGGASPLIANRDTAGPWELFYILPAADGSINIKAGFNGKYVTAENGGASPLIANRDTAGPWEKFVLAPIFNTNYVAIMASINNRYVTAENGGAQALVANRDEIGPWEKFTITKVSDCQIQ